MVNIICVCSGFVLAVLLFFLVKKLATYNLFGLDEIAVGMLPVDRELLQEIMREAQSILLRPRAHDTRRRLRFNLDSIRDQFQRMLKNAERTRYGAQYQWRVIVKNKLQHPPEVLDLTSRLIEVERQLSRRIVWQLCWIWFWNVSGFHKREWGPIPNLQKFPIAQVLEAYESVRSAAIEVMRGYGEAGIAEDLANVM